MSAKVKTLVKTANLNEAIQKTGMSNDALARAVIEQLGTGTFRNMTVMIGGLRSGQQLAGDPNILSAIAICLDVDFDYITRGSVTKSQITQMKRKLAYDRNQAVNELREIVRTAGGDTVSVDVSTLQNLIRLFG